MEKEELFYVKKFQKLDSLINEILIVITEIAKTKEITRKIHHENCIKNNANRIIIKIVLYASPKSKEYSMVRLSESFVEISTGCGMLRNDDVVRNETEFPSNFISEIPVEAK